MDLKTFMGCHKYSEITEEFPDKEKYPLYYETSKQEFTIRAGQKLFIPAGWFHFVFSEDVEEESGLNFAMNFWYYPLNNWSHGKPSNLLPRVEKHDIPNLDPKDVLGDRPVRSTWSDLNGLFPADRTFDFFKGKVRNDYMTFDEFYTAKNPKMYIVQDENKDIVKYAPTYPTPIYLSSSWINYGNCRSLIHCDEHDNWLCQIKGSKRVILFPHEDKDKLYMFWKIPSNVFTEIQDLLSLKEQFVMINTGPIIVPTGEYYRQSIINYHETKLIPAKTGLPQYNLPMRLQCIDTCNQQYSQSQPYPVNFFYITEGKGTITFLGRGAHTLDPGNTIVFPSSFLFPFVIEGNLKLYIPL